MKAKNGPKLTGEQIRAKYLELGVIVASTLPTTKQMCERCGEVFDRLKDRPGERYCGNRYCGEEQLVRGKQGAA